MNFDDDDINLQPRQIKKLAIFFSNATAIADDMNEEKTNALLDDLSTDGKTLYSDKITVFGSDLLFQTNTAWTSHPASSRS